MTPQTLSLLLILPMTLGLLCVQPALAQDAAGEHHAELQGAADLQAKAVALFSEGKFADAVPLQKQALKIREKTLGPNHPQTAEVMHNLAVFYRKTNEYKKAEALFKRALEIRNNVLGEHHGGIKSEAQRPMAA